MRKQGEHKIQANQKSTGPRTEAGKQRSKNNALKSGLFARAILLPNESTAEHRALRKGLWDEFQPETASECEDVEYLASLFWQRRRAARAEDAEMVERVEFNALDLISVQAHEAWIHSRAGESTGGMLQHGSNHLVLRDAILYLTAVRDSLEKYGFQAEPDVRLLRKLYGLDHDGAAPMGLFRMFARYSKLAISGQIGNLGNDDGLRKNSDELKTELLAAFDRELEILKFREEMEQLVDERRRELITVEASILPDRVVDRFIRVRAHLSREIDRTLDRLARAQRRRQGCPEPPTVKLELND
jgi:hypothetical protein